MAADLAPSGRQGEAISVITAGSYCGLAVGPIAAELVVEGAGYGPAWLLATALVVAAGAAAVVLPETRPEGEEEAPRGFIPARSALLPGAILLLALIGFGGFNAFAALHAREVGVERPGVVFLVFAGVVIAVRVAGRRLPDRLGPVTAASVAAPPSRSDSRSSRSGRRRPACSSGRRSSRGTGLRVSGDRPARDRARRRSSGAPPSAR